MSSEPIPALTPIGPFDPGYKPVQEVTPFTYNDGFTYLQKLEVLAYYVNQRLVGSVNDIILAEAGFQTNVTNTISAFTDAQNAAMHALAASLIQYQVLDNKNGTVNYMMEDGSHVSIYTVAGIKAVLDAQDARLTSFQVTMNGAIKDQNDAITAFGNSIAPTARNSVRQTGPMVVVHQLERQNLMMIAVTNDGVNFTPTNTSWYPGAGSDGEMYYRDGSIGQQGGTYYVCFTHPSKVQTPFGVTKDFGLVSTTDWKTFTELSPVSMPADTQQTWAPEFFSDTDGLHVIVSLNRSGDTHPVPGTPFVTYELHPLNGTLTSWSAPARLSGIPASCLDTAVYKDDSGVYHAFASNRSNNAMGVIEHYTGPSLLGPYTQVTTGNFNNLGSGYEGPEPVPLVGGGLRVYFDNTQKIDCLVYTDTYDFVNWTPLQGTNVPMRHIGHVVVDDLPNLRDRLTSVNDPAYWYHSKPWWGDIRQPMDVQKEFIQVIHGTTDASGTITFFNPVTVGFRGVSYLNITLLANVSVMRVNCDINSNSGSPMVTATTLSGDKIPYPNVKGDFAIHLIGFGDPATL